MTHDNKLKGRCRHCKDPTGAYYAFPEWVEHAAAAWLSATCPVPEASVWLAEKQWVEEGIPEDDDKRDGEWAEVNEEDYTMRD